MAVLLEDQWSGPVTGERREKILRESIQKTERPDKDDDTREARGLRAIISAWLENTR